MSFAHRWTSKNSELISTGKKDKKDNTSDSSNSVLSVLIAEESEDLRILWGEHEPLVRWFIENKLALPTESFCLWRDGKCSLWWMRPVAMYQQLFDGILEGPGFEYAEELVSILNQLKAKFGKG